MRDRKKKAWLSLSPKEGECLCCLLLNKGKSESIKAPVLGFVVSFGLKNST